MLHEAIFLATCLATMTTEKHCKLHRGCHTFAIFFRNLQSPRWKLLRTLSLPAWNLLRAKTGFDCLKVSQNCVAGCDGHVTRSKLSRNVAKSWGYFYFSCNSRRNILLPLQGVLHVKSFLQLAIVSQRLLRDKLQEKLPRVTWPCNLYTKCSVKLRGSYQMNFYRGELTIIFFCEFWRHSMKTWKNWPNVFKFQSISILAVRRQETVSVPYNIVFNNKTRPLFLGFNWWEDTFSV